GAHARADELVRGCLDEPGASGDLAAKSWLIAAETERGTSAGEPVHPSLPREGRELSARIGDAQAEFGHWASEVQLLATIGAFDQAIECGKDLVRVSGGRSRFIDLYTRTAVVGGAAAKGDIEPLRAFTAEVSSGATPRLGAYFRGLLAQSLMSHGLL